MKIWRRVIIALAVVIGAVGVYWVYSQYLAPVPAGRATVAPTPSVQPVDTGVNVVSASGNIWPYRSAELAFLTGGRVAEILVARGEQVTAGTPLIRLDAPDLEAAVRQAEAAVAQAEAGVQVATAQQAAAQAGMAAAEAGVAAAEAQYALLVAEPVTQEVAALSANVRAAEALIAQADANRDITTAGARSAQLRSAEAQLAAALTNQRIAQDRYDELVRQGIYGTLEEQARYTLNAATSAVTAAQAALDDLRNGPTADEQRAAQAGVAVTVAQRDVAQAQLDLRLAGPSDEQTRVAQAAIDQAQAALRQAQAAVQQAEANVAQAQAALAQAQAGREAAQVALARMTLNAPFAGQVTDLPVEVGESIAPGAPAATVADFSRWVVKTSDLTELDVVAIGEGMSVQVQVDAIPNETLAGIVSQIAQSSSLARGEVTYLVTIDINDARGLPLRWGMSAFVDISVR